MSVVFAALALLVSADLLLYVLCLMLELAARAAVCAG